MTVSIEEAARLGGSAGLMAEGAPEGFNKWPAAAKTAFHEQYARSRFCRRVAEGRAKPLTIEAPTQVYAGMTRQQLAAEYEASPALRDEFRDKAAFIAFALAEQEGKARIIRGRVVS